MFGDGFDGREPIYVQIAERIRHEVLSGALKEGDQVMSTTQYATTYRINPATAAKAFAQLVDEGVLYKKRGIGMFVSPSARAVLAEDRRERFFSDVVEPMIAQARMLGIPLTDVAERIAESATAEDPTVGGRR
jgi:DNA-binding transcriptional regulator YhcF (GntR family)